MNHLCRVYASSYMKLHATDTFRCQTSKLHKPRKKTEHCNVLRKEMFSKVSITSGIVSSIVEDLFLSVIRTLSENGRRKATLEIIPILMHVHQKKI